MDLKQIKKDRENGVIVCRATMEKLIDAALMMDNVLQMMAICDGSSKNVDNAEILAARIRDHAKHCLLGVAAL